MDLVCPPPVKSSSFIFVFSFLTHPLVRQHANIRIGTCCWDMFLTTTLSSLPFSFLFTFFCLNMLRQVPLMRSRLASSMMGSAAAAAATRMPAFLCSCRTIAAGTMGRQSGKDGMAVATAGPVRMKTMILPRQQQAMTTDASILAASRGTTICNNCSGLVQSIHQTAQQVQTSLSDVFRNAVWQMSSTLKKRRAKMNKHKLRKRRKLERRKSK